MKYTVVNGLISLLIVLICSCNNKSGLYYYNLGIQSDTLHRYKKAVRFYTRAIKKDPALGLAYLRRAKINSYIRFNEKNDNQVINDYRKAIELLIKKEEAYLSRGFFYFTRLRYQDAIFDFDSAINIDSNNVTGYCYRGMTYYAMGDTIKGKEDYKKALELAPSDPYIYLSRGNAFYNSKKYDAALQDYVTYLKLVIDNQYIKKRVIVLRWQLGDKEVACKEFKQLDNGTTLWEIPKDLRDYCESFPKKNSD